MKRFLLLVLSILCFLLASVGIIFAIVGFESNDKGMSIAGCIFAIPFALLFIRCILWRKQLKPVSTTSVSSAPQQTDSVPTTPSTQPNPFGIDYVVNVGRKGSVCTLMVHYHSGKVKRVRTGYDSIQFRHYAKYIKR